jgi:hypothetical protein
MKSLAELYIASKKFKKALLIFQQLKNMEVPAIEILCFDFFFPPHLFVLLRYFLGYASLLYFRSLRVIFSR